ncbi:hypothetical protein [Saccharopolyspora taberi]|uniref:Uncharacterized protein n=1 Tax=Saccharopolyspora taberi TaxID=60895 RepID=A0ABN3VKU9_9PSEU
MALHLVLAFVAWALIFGPMFLLWCLRSRPQGHVDAAMPRRDSGLLARGGAGRPVDGGAQGVLTGRPSGPPKPRVRVVP